MAQVTTSRATLSAFGAQTDARLGHVHDDRPMPEMEAVRDAPDVAQGCDGQHHAERPAWRGRRGDDDRDRDREAAAVEVRGARVAELERGYDGTEGDHTHRLECDSFARR